jgi:transcriptional regulator with XRE-family HTH domain
MGGSRVTGKDLTDFGWWLQDKLRERELTQTALADKARVAQATISRWTEKDIRPDTKKLAQVADALGLNDAERVEMFARAGHHATATAITDPPVIEARPLPPILAEAWQMLDPASPLSDEARAEIETWFDRILGLHRPAMRRRKTG